MIGTRFQSDANGPTIPLGSEPVTTQLPSQVKFRTPQTVSIIPARFKGSGFFVPTTVVSPQCFKSYGENIFVFQSPTVLFEFCFRPVFDLATDYHLPPEFCGGSCKSLHACVACAKRCFADCDLRDSENPFS